MFVADAPPHGMGYTVDSYPNGSPNKHDPIAIAHEMAARGIVVYSVGCEPVLGSTAFARDVSPLVHTCLFCIYFTVCACASIILTLLLSSSKR